MLAVGTVLMLLVLVTFLAIITKRWTIPYPTIMVVAGLGIALIPGLPAVQLTPEVIFLIFLPPLLYAAAWNIPFQEFKRNLRPISLLAFGLVLATTAIVAIVAKFCIPDMPWAAAFALGAIISPPDAIAATALTRILPIPRRIVVILEGESLLNDATGLVAYRVAIIAASTGTFSLTESIAAFVWAVMGGVGIGFGIGWLVCHFHRMLEDPVIETTISLLTPFAVYLPCEGIHASGVLGVVTAGLYVRQQSESLLSSSTRLHARSVWETVLFVLNGLTFILIGLGLRDIVTAISDDPLWWSVSTTVAILLTTILVRIIWVFPAAYAPRWILKSLATGDPPPPLSHLWIIGWTGMRGVVSLAAALALPLDFPKRDLILFIAFGVILGTLVLQGLSLPWMIRRLGIGTDGRSHIEQEIDARLWTLAAANAYLEKASTAQNQNQRDLEFLRSHFELQSSRIVAKLNFDLEDQCAEFKMIEPMEQHLYLGALNAQRKRLHELENSGVIDDDLYLRLSREIDLEEARLESTVAIHISDRQPLDRHPIG